MSLNVAFLSYREWANPVFEAVKKHPKIGTIKRFSSSEQFIQYYGTGKGLVSTTSTPDLVIYCGWSEEPLENWVKRVLHVGVHCAEADLYSGGSPLQNQILDGIKITKHRIFKVWYPELSLREWSHEVDLNLSGNMKDILDQCTYTSIDLFTRFLDDHPGVGKEHDIDWKQWPESTVHRPRRKPEESILTKDNVANMTTKQLYDFFRCLEDPYPNGSITDEHGTLYVKNVGFKAK